MAKNYILRGTRPTDSVISVGWKRDSRTARRHDSPRRRCHHESTHANDKIDQGFELSYLFIYLFIGHGVTLR
jgi:hypothetical protein